MGNQLLKHCCGGEAEPVYSFQKHDHPRVVPKAPTGLPKPNVTNVTKPKAILKTSPKFDAGTFHAKYEMKQMLGNGSTCVCHLCVDKKSHKKFACKIIDKRMSNSKNQLNLLLQFKVEIQVLQSLQHPNIIALKDVYDQDSKIYMITELMNGGELFEYIVEKGTLSEMEASCIVNNVTSALAYMHYNGVVHRDLKPENLLLTKKGKDASVKIIDFGLAKLLENNNSTTSSFLGTRGYLAPEMLRRQAYSKAVDVWALGVIVYVLLCGCLPFDDDGSKISSEQAAHAKFGLRFPKWANDLSSNAKDLLKNLLQVDSTKRYTAQQALSHPWVNGIQVSSTLLESPKHLRQMKQNTNATPTNRRGSS